MEVTRLHDSEFGQSRYQIRLHVRNDEPAPGLLRVKWSAPKKEKRDGESPPIRIDARASVEIGVVTTAPPTEVTLEPYLSLNRQPVRLDLPAIDSEAPVEDEPFEGWRPSDWRPPPPQGIVVDDLDIDFAIDEAVAERIRDGDIGEVDAGLPAFGSPGSGLGWSRQELDGTWGKYRHTLARSMSSSAGYEAVTFTARLPHAGRWRLDYHLPSAKSRSRSWQSRVAVRVGSGGVNVDQGEFWKANQGPYDMQLIADGTPRTIEFDGSAAVAGWNNLGEFELDAGETRLVVSNKSGGQNNDRYTIVADAIRWLPVNSK